MKHDITSVHIQRGEYHEPLRNSKEVAEEFGFKSANSLHALVRKKSFPEPDFVCKSSLGGQGGRKLFWRLSTLKKEKQRRLKCM